MTEQEIRSCPIAVTCAKAALEMVEAARTGQQHRTWTTPAHWLAEAASQVAAIFEALEDARPEVADWPLLASLYGRICEEQRQIPTREEQWQAGELIGPLALVAVAIESLATRCLEMLGEAPR